ncbi:hypothetical protein LCGC14_3118660 [marine sediment metagenome]|uniref:Uncharacterized protein n=1 Tax=marine sediment metagenome TaxID=412755 RepID=A0A0F8WRW0_9ZZZZ
MPEITTTVVAKSTYGIKVKQDGPWWNFSKVEFRGERFDTTVQKGDRVWIEYQEKEYGDADPDGERETKCWISQIEKVTAARETSQDQPFPPVDDFPPDEGGDLGDDRAFPTDAGSATTSASSEPDVVYGQDIWAKDALRARTDCIACATGIFKSCLEAGILKEFPSASAVVAYAVELEKWAKE